MNNDQLPMQCVLGETYSYSPNVEILPIGNVITVDAYYVKGKESYRVSISRDLQNKTNPFHVWDWELKEKA